MTRCQLGHIVISRCRLDQVDLQDCDLRGADLRETDLSTVIGISNLRGSIITASQIDELAATLARELTLTVRALGEADRGQTQM